VIEQYKQIQEKVFIKLQKIMQDPETYSLLLNSLVREALTLLGKDGLVLVKRGDSSFVEKQDACAGIKETDIDPNGGCIVLDPREGKIVIDNTMLSRWTKMKDQILLRIAEQINEIILDQKIQPR